MYVWGGERVGKIGTASCGGGCGGKEGQLESAWGVVWGLGSLAGIGTGSGMVIEAEGGRSRGWGGGKKEYWCGGSK